MTQDKIAALLGRPLSSVETSNFKTYLELAESRVSDLLCFDICQRVETRRFSTRLGYKTLNVPVFTEIDYVKLDGNETTNYEVRQSQNLNGDWYNTIVFDTPLHGQTVEVKADWGFAKTPLDVQMMIATVFGMTGDSLESDTVATKKVEDFSISFNKTKTEAFATKYAATIAKYSGCVSGNVQSGKTYGHLYYV